DAVGERHVLERDDTELAADRTQQLARLEQEGRVRRLPETLLAAGEGLVDERAARFEAVDEERQQWTMEVVRHHDATEASLPERPRCPILEVGTHDLEIPSRRQRARVTIDRDHAMAALEEESRMASAAGRDVEHD